MKVSENYALPPDHKREREQENLKEGKLTRIRIGRR
jgi:hypothetical protein